MNDLVPAELASQGVREEAIELHEHADRCSNILFEHRNDLPLAQIGAVVEYHDSLREKAQKLTDLSYRLREQARRVAQERMGGSLSCRVCQLSIPESEDGLCYICRAEFASHGNRSRCG